MAKSKILEPVVRPVLKLWQAMLAGCDRRAQAFDTLFDKDGDMITSCAMGAAIEGAYNFVPQGENDAREPYLIKLREDYPILGRDFNWQMEGHENEDELLQNLEVIIIDANDRKHWTRERIALEIIKPKEDPEDQS